MSLTDKIPSPAPAPDGRGEAAVQHLLVGVDGSDAAGAAASFAIWLAGAADSQVTLLHACPDLRLAEHAPHTADARALLAAAEHRAAQTTEWQRRLQNLSDYAAEGAHVQSRVVRGQPAAALLSAAGELDTDVILVGSTGVGSLRGRFLGSVSSQVVDHARCSVMVFPEGQTSAPAHVASVVVGVDGSTASAAAIAAGSALAAAVDAKLVLVTAYEPSTALAPHTSELRAELRQHAVNVLAGARAAVSGDTEVLEEPCEGGVRQVLVEACELYGPSVLVVGTRGLGGFRGLLLGSTSRWVLNHAPCPVLVARHRQDANPADS